MVTMVETARVFSCDEPSTSGVAMLQDAINSCRDGADCAKKQQQRLSRYTMCVYVPTSGLQKSSSGQKSSSSEHVHA